MNQLKTLTILGSLALASCQGVQTPENKTPAPPTTSKTEKTMSTPTETLKSQLDNKRIGWEAKAPDSQKKLYGDGIQAVIESGVLESAKQVGQQAPDFELTNALGKTVKLSDYLKKGPVVLTWYRGGWCPYCNLTLHKLQEELPNFEAAGATLLALTPEVPDKSMSTVEKHALKFEVLSDLHNKIGKEYGVVFTLMPDLAKAYQKGFGLHGVNGDASDELPLAATYVIGTDGVITYAYLNGDYRNRAEPSEVLEAVKAIQ